MDLCNHCYSFVADDVCAVDGEGYVEDFSEEEGGEGNVSWEWLDNEEGTNIHPSGDEDY